MSDILQGLPDDVMSALPDQTAADAAASTPVIPGTRMPIPPTVAQPAPAAPDIQPGSLADKISAAFLQHIASRQPAPPANSDAGQRAAQSQPSTAQNVVRGAE